MFLVELHGYEQMSLNYKARLQTPDFSYRPDTPLHTHTTSCIPPAAIFSQAYVLKMHHFSAQWGKVVAVRCKVIGVLH